MHTDNVLFVVSPTGWTAIDGERRFHAQGKTIHQAWQNLKLAKAEIIAFYERRGLKWKER